MRNLLRKIFRYPAVDLYMFFSCIIAFVALFISLSIFNEIGEYEDDRDQMQFKSRYIAELTKTEDFDLSNIRADINCNIALTGVHITLSEEKVEYNTEAHVVFRSTEYIYPLISGNYPEINKEAEPVCVIGKSVADMFKKSAGDYLSIDGSDYRVSGIIGSNRSEYLDWYIILWYTNLSDRTMDHLRLYDTVNLLLESNTNDTYTCYKEMYSILEDSKGFIHLTGIQSHTDDSIGRPRSEAYFYILLYAFAVLHCVVASDIWIYERRYELSVKKTLGYSSTQLKIDLFIQLFLLALTASIFCAFIQGFFLLAGERMLGIKLSFTYKNVIIILIFTFITCLLSLWRHIRRLDQKEAIKSLQDRSDGI